MFIPCCTHEFYQCLLCNHACKCFMYKERPLCSCLSLRPCPAMSAGGATNPYSKYFLAQFLMYMHVP